MKLNSEDPSTFMKDSFYGLVVSIDEPDLQGCAPKGGFIHRISVIL